jgi:tetratricopeptide (TPR) repeat protein
MSTPLPTLDADELFHLALKATQENQTEQAIEYLKRAVNLNPQNSKAHYLLGALHAEIGMYDRAALEMDHALEIEPDLHAARFQLGLLHLTSARLDLAKTAWQPLEKLGEEDPFYLFKTGMLLLAEDDFENCMQYLEKGIEKNTINLPLNNDMARVLEKAKAAMQNSKTDAANDNPADKSGEDSSSPKGRHVLLSAYNRDDDDKTH